MSTMLLECCTGAAKIVKCGCTNEAVTNCKDVKMAQLVCCTIVCVVLILTLGAIAWRLIDHHAAKKASIRKRRWEFANKNRELRFDLLEKKLAAIEKHKGGEYLTAVEAAITEIKA